MIAKIAVVLSRLFLGIIIGLLIGSAVWWLSITLGGHTVEDALQGRVEDAIGRLHGSLALGTAVGGGVGVLHGILTIVNKPRVKD